LKNVYDLAGNPANDLMLGEYETFLTGNVDLEAIALGAKKDLALITPEGKA